WTVKNTGDAPVWAGTAYWRDAVYLSRDPVFDVRRAKVLGKFVHSNATPLQDGASYTSTEEVTLPPGVEGNWYVYVFTDYYETPEGPLTPPGRQGRPYDDGLPSFFYHLHAWEGGADLENNNLGRGTLPVIYREPDLVVSDLLVPTGTVYSGQAIHIEWTVKNQ